jgi:hypothetical protein
LAPPTPDKVPLSYRQELRINGEKVSIQTSNYHTKHGIFMYNHGANQISMIIPVDAWLRRQLTTYQNFVVSNVVIPLDVPQTSEGTYVFKPLLEENTKQIFVSVSKWCKIFKFESTTGVYIRQEKFSQFEKGSFNVTIDVSHVYIGPHKGGHTFSLSLRVKQLVYEEEPAEDNDTSLLDELLTVEAEIEKKKKNKRGKKVRKIEKCHQLENPGVSHATGSKN